MRETPIIRGDTRPPFGRHSIETIHASWLDAFNWRLALVLLGLVFFWGAAATFFGYVINWWHIAAG